MSARDPVVESVLAKITPQWMDKIFSELTEMDVELDDEPLQFGPRRLAHKIAESRKHLSRSEQMFQEISRDLRVLSREKNNAQTQYKLQEAHLLSNDPEVRSGRNIKDRDALVSVKLATEVEYIHRIDQAIQDLECVDKVVKSRRIDLKDIQGRIKDQVNLCREEVGMGSHWGAALPPGARVAFAPRSFHKEIDEIDQIIQSEKIETKLPQGDWEEPEIEQPVQADEPLTPADVSVDPAWDSNLDSISQGSVLPLAGSATDGEIDSFLNSPDEENARKGDSTPEFDLDDLLGSI